MSRCALLCNFSWPLWLLILHFKLLSFHRTSATPKPSLCALHSPASYVLPLSLPFVSQDKCHPQTIAVRRPLTPRHAVLCLFLDLLLHRTSATPRPLLCARHVLMAWA
jgi:hypothetical protein